MTFKDITSLSPLIIQTLDEQGITEPTEIQRKAIPALLEADVDFLGQAQTGTGKTFAFGIPLVQKIDTSKKTVQGLVVAPTRELVGQITQSLKLIAKPLGITVDSIYGGVSMFEQISALKRGVHIVVGTPGRLNDHLRRKTLSLANLKTLVLDEADIMLDMGFKQEVDEILSYCPAKRNIWLFSATIKSGISEIMSNHMHDPMSVRVSKSQVGTSKTLQYFCVVPSRDRLTALTRIIDTTPTFYGFVFCQTKMLTAEIAEELVKQGYRAQALHGDMSQAQRNRVIKQFKNRECTILVATDVAARGIDVADLTHVINYSLPEDQESYVHRIGRTGRAGKEGTAITFISQRELGRIKSIERKFTVQIKPLDVPSMADIATIRVAQAAEFVTVACHKKDETVYAQQLRKLVEEYEKNDLVNAVVCMLQEKFHIKDQRDIQFTKADSVSMDSVSEHSAHELVIYLGLDDDITAQDIKDLLIEKAPQSAEYLPRIKVLKRRSFIKLPAEIAQELSNAINGAMINSRKVRSAVQEDTGYQPSGRSGRSDRSDRSDRYERGGDRDRGGRSGGRGGRGGSRFGGRR